LRRVVFAGALAVALFAPQARAYRPFDGTDADVSKLGELELELGPLGFLRAQHDSALVFANTVLNYGVLPRWELVVQGQGVYGLDTPPPPRFLNGGVFLKHVLREGVLQGRPGVSLAMETGVLFPTSDAPIDDAGVYLGMIASYAWTELVLHFNVALSRAVDGQPDVFASLILEGHPAGRIRPVSEILVERHGPSTDASWLVGFIVRASERVAFDAATRAAWSEGAPLFEVRAGLTWSIETRRARATRLGSD